MRIKTNLMQRSVFQKFALEKILACLAAMGLVLGGGAASDGAMLSFVPAGTQLDGDPINDIVTVVGAPIAFNVMIDTVGLAGPLENFKYTASWDPTELTFVGLALDGGMPGPGGNFPVDMPPGPFDGPAASTPSHSGGAIAAGTPLFLLDTWNFIVAAGLVNNGVFDFKIDIFLAESRVAGVLVNQNGLYNPFQEVEVQPEDDVQPIPEPGTLLLFTTGIVGVGILQRLRRKQAA